MYQKLRIIQDLIKNLSFEEILLDEISSNVNSDIFFEQKEKK